MSYAKPGLPGAPWPAVCPYCQSTLEGEEHPQMAEEDLLEKAATVMKSIFKGGSKAGFAAGSAKWVAPLRNHPDHDCSNQCSSAVTNPAHTVQYNSSNL